VRWDWAGALPANNSRSMAEINTDFFNIIGQTFLFG
jgi:hypothetical protein